MSLLPRRYLEHREREGQILTIRLRIERRYARLKSFSASARRTFAEHDIRAALVEAGLPLPVEISFEEKVRRNVYLTRNNRSRLRRMEPTLRAAVLAELAKDGAQ